MLILQITQIIMEGKIIYKFIVALFFITSCNKTTNVKNTNEVDKVTDTVTLRGLNTDTINVVENEEKSIDSFKLDIEKSINEIKLHDVGSLLKKVGNPVFLENNLDEFPNIVIYNKNKKEKITCLFYPGNTKNSISYFILENEVNDILKGKNIFHVNDKSFKTNNNISLGVSKDIIIKNYKNLNYELISVDNGASLSLKLDNFSNNSFLEKANMPLYQVKYFFDINNMVKRVEFGFLYP